MSDIVLHYTTGQMDRFHSQVKKLKQLDQTVLDPSEPWEKPRTEEKKKKAKIYTNKKKNKNKYITWIVIRKIMSVTFF